jgi:hypothetical protein
MAKPFKGRIELDVRDSITTRCSGTAGSGNREGIGPLKLYIDDEIVAEDETRTVVGHFSLCGDGLCIGYDSADAVSSAYAGSRFEFTGGEIVKVDFDIADDAYIDVEQHLAAAMARD